MASQKIQIMHKDPPIQGQTYFCMSVVGPNNSRQKADAPWFKIRYVGKDLEDTERVAKHLRDTDNAFDVYIAEVGSWLPFVDSPDKVPVAKYTNEQLDKLIHEHRRIQQENETMFANRVTRETQYIMQDGKGQGSVQTSAIEEAIKLRYNAYKLKTHVDARLEEYKALIAQYEKFPSDIREVADIADLPKIDSVAPAAASEKPLEVLESIEE